MRHHFQKGQPRPAKAGRRTGTPNRSTCEIRTFARCLLEDREYQKQLRQKLRNLTLDPSLIRMLYQYAYGRPPEKIELSGPDRTQMDSIVHFYIPEKAAIASPDPFDPFVIDPPAVIPQQVLLVNVSGRE